MLNKTIPTVLAIVLLTLAGFAQTTESTYQGQLQSSSAAANGSFDFEFLLFDAATGGAQIGATAAQNNVQVANGIFSVKLDFGQVFTGAARFLEINVRTAGGGAFTPLSPRQPVSSAPYSIKSLNSDTAVNATNATTAATATNALSLGGVTAIGYLQTNGNGSGLVNLNASNIVTGTLANARLGQLPTANIADSAITSPKIATGQVVKGVTVGATTLTDNVTLAAGSNVTITPAGNTLTIASTGGAVNAILNQTAPQANADFNISGSGTIGGTLTANGTGLSTGVTGKGFLQGLHGEASATSATSAVNVVGVYGTSTCNEVMFCGSAVGVLGSVTDYSGKGVLGLNTLGVGVEGFSTSGLGMHGSSSTSNGMQGNSTSGSGVFGTTTAVSLQAAGVYGQNAGTGGIGVLGRADLGGAVGVYGVSASSTGFGMYAINKAGGRALYVDGPMGLNSLAPGGIDYICLNGDKVANCSSSLRYKKDIRPFGTGLSFINQLHPIAYKWKSNEMADTGFAAEDVAKIDKRFVSYNAKGEVEGVKYDRLTAVLVNALKEQQKQIEALRSLVCRSHRRAAVCRTKK